MDRREFITLSAATALFGCSAAKKALVRTETTMTQDYFSAFGIDARTMARILAKSMEKGADWADLFFEHTQYLSLSLQDGIVNRASSDVDLGLGVRAVEGDRIGYAFTEALTLEAMEEAAERAACIASGKANPEIALARQKIAKRYYDPCEELENPEIAKLVALLQRIDKKTRRDPEVEKVTVAVSSALRRITVASTHGDIISDTQPMTSLHLSIVMHRNGERQSNSEKLSRRDNFDTFFDEGKIDAFIEDLTRRTRILYDAVKPKAGFFPVVLGAGASGILLHEAIGHGMEADLNRKKMSIFSDMMNKRVASDEVTVLDSALHEKSRGSVNIDDEGTPGQETVLVENGILKSYMHDKISAKHYGVKETGNARRESFRFQPIPRMRTTYMKNGSRELDELIANVDYGIYCTHFTNGQVLIGPGDYTFYVKNGFLIEKGKLTAPIKDVNIIGNGPDSLSKITMVGNDFAMHGGGWVCGKAGQSVPVSLGMPSVLISGITVGGV